MKPVSFAKRLSNAILAFLLVVALFGLLFITVMRSTLFSSGFFASQVDKSGFSQLALDEIHEIFRSYANASNIPADFLAEHLTLEQVDDAIKQTTAGSYNNTDPYAYYTFTDELFADLKDYAKSQQLILSADLTQQLADFAIECEQAFIRYTDTSVFSQVAGLARAYRPVLAIGQVALAVVVIVLVLLLAWFAPSWADFWCQAIYSMSAVTMLCAACFCARFFLGFLSKIKMAPESTRVLFMVFTQNVVAAFVWPLVASALALACTIVAYRRACKASHKQAAKRGKRQYITKKA